MDLSIFNGYYLTIVSVFLPLVFGVYLIVKRLSLSVVKKNILEYGSIIISFVCLLCFLAQKFIFLPFESSFDILSTDEIMLKIGLMVDNVNINFLIYSAVIYFFIAIFARNFFKRKKQFIFTRLRYQIFLSLLFFNIFLCFCSVGLIQAFIFWVLAGISVCIFSYFDIFKYPQSSGFIRYFRINLIGYFTFLAFILFLFKYASSSNGYIDSQSLDFSFLDTLTSYSLGLCGYYENLLMLFCIIVTVTAGLFLFPMNCYYSFFANSSNLLYLTVMGCANPVIPIYFLYRVSPISGLYSEYKLYAEIFIALTILTSMLFLLFEKNLKIIIGHILSIMNALFLISYMNFDHKITFYAYFIALIIIQLIVARLFFNDISSLNFRIINKQKGFILERVHILFFEKFLISTPIIFTFINENIIKNLIKIPYAIFGFVSKKSLFSQYDENDIAEKIKIILSVFLTVVLIAVIISMLGDKL